MNKVSLRIAVIGATGAVGREVIKIIQEKFKSVHIQCFASNKSINKKIKILNKTYILQRLTNKSIQGFHFVFFTTSSEISKKWAPIIRQTEAFIIDNSSAFRMKKEIPLVVPEINGEEIIKKKSKIIANPNCTTAQMVMVLKPLHDQFKLKRVILSSYQAVSGRGHKGSEEFLTQIKYGSNKIKPKQFPHPIAFNCIPQVDVFGEQGFTGEEWKVMNETKKILNLPRLNITATCVRVPVLNAHSESVIIETFKPISVNRAQSVLKKFKGIRVCDDPKKEIYPLAMNVSGQDDVFVGRIRKDLSLTRGGNGLMLWIVGDNLRKGAALNAVQIMEYILKHRKRLDGSKQ